MRGILLWCKVAFFKRAWHKLIIGPHTENILFMVSSLLQKWGRIFENLSLTLLTLTFLYSKMGKHAIIWIWAFPILEQVKMPIFDYKAVNCSHEKKKSVWQYIFLIPYSLQKPISHSKRAFLSLLYNCKFINFPWISLRSKKCKLAVMFGVLQTN